MTTVGTVGLSLVWGWLLVLAGQGSSRFWRSVTALALVTLLVALVLFSFTEWRQVLVFAGGTAVSLTTHLAWRQKVAAGTI